MIIFSEIAVKNLSYEQVLSNSDQFKALTNSNIDHICNKCQKPQDKTAKGSPDWGDQISMMWQSTRSSMSFTAFFSFSSSFFVFYIHLLCVLSFCNHNIPHWMAFFYILSPLLIVFVSFLFLWNLRSINLWPYLLHLGYLPSYCFP